MHPQTIAPPSAIPAMPQAQTELEVLLGKAARGEVTEADLNIDDPEHATVINFLREQDSKRPVYLKLYQTDEIPGDSLPVCVNDKRFYIPVKRWVRVPNYVAEVLRRSRRKDPEKDENEKIIGFADNPRFNFLVQDAVPEADEDFQKTGIRDLYPKRP